MRNFLKSPNGSLLWPIIGSAIVIAVLFMGHQIAGNNPMIPSIVIMVSGVLMVFSKVDDKKELRTVCATNIATILATIAFTIELPEWLIITIGSSAGVFFCFALAKSWEIAKDDIVYVEEEWPWLTRWVALSLVQAGGVWWTTYSILKNADDMSTVWQVALGLFFLNFIFWLRFGKRYWKANATQAIISDD